MFPGPETVHSCTSNNLLHGTAPRQPPADRTLLTDSALMHIEVDNAPCGTGKQRCLGRHLIDPFREAHLHLLVSVSVLLVYELGHVRLSPRKLFA